MQGRSPPKHRHDGTSPLPLGMDWSPPPRKWNGRDTVWPHDHRTGWSYCVTIPSWVLLPKSRDSDPVVFYRVQVCLQSPEGVTTVRGVLRRFNDFLRLFSDLKKAFPKKNLPPAPPKGLLRIKSRALLDERRCSLEEWMTKLLSDLDLSRSFAVASFLELEAAARSSFQDANQNVPEALGSGNSSVSSHQPQNDSALSVVAGGSSLTSDYGSDTAYENSELGTPTLGRHESSDVGVEEFSLDEDLPNPIDRLVKYGVSNIDEGLFMGEAILEQLEGFDRRKIHGNHVNIGGKNLENGNISKVPYLTGNDLELFTEPDHFKVTGHTRKLSSDSISSDVSSLRGSESSNSGMPNSSGNGSAYLSGAVETSSAPEILGNTELHASGDGQVILPMDQRSKLNRVVFSFQRRLVTAKTDMEDLISRLNQETTVKDYLMTKVKDLEVELETTKQKSKENLEQAILAESERFTQMQWDMEELRQRSYEMELKLKSKQDGESSSESTGASFSPQREQLLQELDESKLQVGNLQKRYEELELRSKADLKVLVKEVKSLRNSQNHLKQELSQSLEEKRKVEKLLEEEKQINQQCETALNKLLQECKTIHTVLQDCVVNITAEDVKDLDSSSVEGIQFSSTLDDRIGHITAQAHMLAQEGHAAASDIYGDNGVNDNTRMVEDELKTTIANIIIDSSTLFRKQVNSVLQCSLNDVSETETAEAPTGKS